MNNLKIIRTFWGNDKRIMSEIPIVPLYDNEIVYVWGDENNKWLTKRGYNTKIVNKFTSSKYTPRSNMFIKKLIALDLALQEFNEVILLDWDCYILRNFDDNFYNHLKEKPIQCPLYSHNIDIKNSCLEMDKKHTQNVLDFIDTLTNTIPKYSWKMDNMYISPNFCFVYSRDKSLGKELLNITLKNNITGCIEEHAMFLYANCSIEEYIERYQPKVVRGISPSVTKNKFMAEISRKKFNDYLDTKINMDVYLEHI